MVPRLTGLVLAVTVAAASAEIAIVPRPSDVVPGRGTFRLRPTTVLVADPDAVAEAETLAGDLGRATGYRLRVMPSRRARRRCPPDAGPGRCRSTIRLRLDPGADLGDEGYRLVVRRGRVTIRARTTAGLFYGGQTLRQLFPPAMLSATVVEGVAWTAPAVRVDDRPRFPWRGMHLDVARSFMPIEFVGELIDVLALHKVNRLHWHLTDDQGWRLEIRAYPELTRVGGTRAASVVRPIPTGGLLNILVTDFGAGPLDDTPVTGFYTQAEVRALVARAARRHVTIVPEIDLPGHTQAAIAAYPALGNVGPVPVASQVGIRPHVLNVDEATFAFLETVLGEVMDLFPGPFVHLGGDEVRLDEWRASPAVQARLVALGLPDEEALLGWFANRLAAIVAARGRRMIGWNEVLRDGLAPEVAIMSWLGVAPGVAAARSGRDVVMTPLTDTYLDHLPGQPLPGSDQAVLESLLDPAGPAVTFLTTTLAEAYAFDPVPADLEPEAAAHVLGTQGLVWTEFIRTPEEVEQFAFPRMAALAEVAWTPRDRRDHADFTRRLVHHLARLDALGVAWRLPDAGA